MERVGHGGRRGGDMFEHILPFPMLLLSDCLLFEMKYPAFLCHAFPPCDSALKLATAMNQDI